MPTLLTVTQIREHVETDLVDDALTRLVEDADQEIIDRLGALASQVEVFDAEGLHELILARKASSISSVTETVAETEDTLAANDYYLYADGRRLERRQGTNEPRLYWRGIAKVTYVPVDETARRKRLLIDLVKLAVAYDARQSKSLGDYSVQNKDYQKEREALFRSLRTSGRLPLA